MYHEHSSWPSQVYNVNPPFPIRQRAWPPPARGAPLYDDYDPLYDEEFDPYDPYDHDYSMGELLPPEPLYQQDRMRWKTDDEANDIFRRKSSYSSHSNVYMTPPYAEMIPFEKYSPMDDDEHLPYVARDYYGGEISPYGYEDESDIFYNGMSEPDYEYSPYHSYHDDMFSFPEYYIDAEYEEMQAEGWHQEELQLGMSSRKIKKLRKCNECWEDIEDELAMHYRELHEQKLSILLEELEAIESYEHKVYKKKLSNITRTLDDEVKKATLIAEYQLSHAQKQYDAGARVVEEETQADKDDLKAAMLSLINEKRRRLKKDERDESGNLIFSGLTDTPTVDNVLSKNAGVLRAVAKRRVAVDRQKDMANLSNALTVKDEGELTSDLHLMRRLSSTHKTASKLSSSQRLGVGSSNSASAL